MLSWAEFINDLGFVLAVDHCARGCLHCPAYGSTIPVQRANIGQLAQRLTEIADARSRLQLGPPQRVIHSWRISDPLDYLVRCPGGTVASIADVAELWREHFGQGLYVVTNGSESRPQAGNALRRLVADPDLISQLKVTVTPADISWGTSRYESDLAADLAVVAPLWELPSTRIEDPHGRRLRINVKASPPQLNDAAVVVARILEAAGLDPRSAEDPTKVSFKPIYDLGNALDRPSPVVGAVGIVSGGQRSKPTPETRLQIQYGIRPDGRLFKVDMYAFAERDLTNDDGTPLYWPGTIADLDSPVNR